MTARPPGGSAGVGGSSAAAGGRGRCVDGLRAVVVGGAAGGGGPLARKPGGLIAPRTRLLLRAARREKMTGWGLLITNFRRVVRVRGLLGSTRRETHFLWSGQSECGGSVGGRGTLTGKFSGRGSHVPADMADMAGLRGWSCHGGFRAALRWGTRAPGLPLPAGYSEAPRATPRICPPVPRPGAGSWLGGASLGVRALLGVGMTTHREPQSGQAAAGPGKWRGGCEPDEGAPMTLDSPRWPDQTPVFLHGSWKLPVT